jgi:Multicopper oxidase
LSQFPFFRPNTPFEIFKETIKDNSITLLLYSHPVIRAVHHPLHLHGHQFVVNGMGQENEITAGVMPSASQNPSPTFRDTVTVPSRGYAKIKFRANNPGKRGRKIFPLSLTLISSFFFSLIFKKVSGCSTVTLTGTWVSECRLSFKWASPTKWSRPQLTFQRVAITSLICMNNCKAAKVFLN